MSRTVVARMGGRMDEGFYATIPGVAKYLRVTYDRAQKMLREEFIAGNLIRARLGRHVIYTSKQGSLF